ncbi:MAG TPA: hypothetical protein VFQ76_11220 [Longimicrobiaceae bacterium]|nr:hypothetical protein [Longimicrobiaceae bacterium]
MSALHAGGQAFIAESIDSAEEGVAVPSLVFRRLADAVRSFSDAVQLRGASRPAFTEGLHMTMRELLWSAADRGSRPATGSAPPWPRPRTSCSPRRTGPRKRRGRSWGRAPPTVRRWRLCGIRLVRERVRLRMLARLAGQEFHTGTVQDGSFRPARGRGGGAGPLGDR